MRYGETDKMGIVFNSNYLSWFEIARTELCRSLGRSYAEWEADGYLLPVAEAYCRYKASARYDDIVHLYCRAPIDEIKPHSMLFKYLAYNESDTLLAEGWTKHAFVDANGKLYRKNNRFQEWLIEASSK